MNTCVGLSTTELHGAYFQGLFCTSQKYGIAKLYTVFTVDDELFSLLDYAVEEKPSHISVMQQLEDGGPDPLVFVLNANLLSMVKIVNCKFFFIWGRWQRYIAH